MKIYEYIIKIREQGIDKLRRLANTGSSIRASLGIAGRSVMGFGRQLKGLGGDILNFVGLNTTLLRVLGPAALGATLAMTSARAVTLAADLEQVTVGFEVMLGSAEKAHALIKDIRHFAKITPFETTDLVRASEILLGFGVAGEDVMGTLNMLGDVARGNADKLRLISLAYAQIQAAGRLMGQDLLQLVNAGFNPLQEISRKTGRSMAQLKKDMEEGKISAAMVTAAFRSATSEGGRFFGMMDRQSRTFHGMASTLRDEWTEMLTSLGEKVLPMAIEGVRGLGSVLNDLTTRVDFDPLLTAVRDTVFVVREAWGLFQELLTLLGVSTSQVDVLQFAVNGLAFAIRTGFLPLRLLLTGLQLFVKVVSHASQAGEGFGMVLAGMFTRNFGLISAGIEQTKKAFSEGFDDIGKQIMDFAKKEAEGYEKIFTVGARPAEEIAGLTTGRPGGSSGGSGSGVDPKLQDGLDKISGGGKQAVNVTINIDELIGIKGDPRFNNVKEGFTKIRETLVKELLQVVNSANYAAAQ